MASLHISVTTTVATTGCVKKDIYNWIAIFWSVENMLTFHILLSWIVTKINVQKYSLLSVLLNANLNVQKFKCLNWNHSMLEHLYFQATKYKLNKWNWNLFCNIICILICLSCMVNKMTMTLQWWGFLPVATKCVKSQFWLMYTLKIMTVFLM